MAASIARGSIFIECNHFGGALADLDAFRRSELFYGSELLSRDGGTVGGMLHVLRESAAEIRPLFVATACPSAPVTAECYRHLKKEMLDRLQRAMPADGVLLALHGSAAVDGAGHPRHTGPHTSDHARENVPECPAAVLPGGFANSGIGAKSHVRHLPVVCTPTGHVTEFPSAAYGNNQEELNHKDTESTEINRPAKHE
jgi:hypothetical protein